MDAIVTYLAAHGFKAVANDATVTVQDPIHASRGGVLVLTGYRPVTIRSMVEAWKFVEARS